MATLTEDLAVLETKEGKLVDNKVSKFCYEESAYTNDEADGVTDYRFERAMNVPVDTPSVIKLNPTVVNKGFRTQASSLPRMATNHFFGRVSYNLNKTVDVLKAFITRIKEAIGTAYGLASLDSEAKVPNEQLHTAEANGLASLDSDGKLEATQMYGSGFSSVLGRFWRNLGEIPINNNGIKTVSVGNTIFVIPVSYYNYSWCSSHDAGETWNILQPSDIFSEYDYFASSLYKLKNKVYCALRKSSDNYTEIFSTSDGITWQSDVLPVKVSTAYAYIAGVLDSKDLSLMYVKGEGLFYSADTVTWEKVISSDGTYYNCILGEQHYKGNHTGFYYFMAVIGSTTYVSLDAITWEQKGSVSGVDAILPVGTATNSWIAYKKEGTSFYYTTNSGQTWTSKAIDSSINSIHSVVFVSSKIVMATDKGSYTATGVTASWVSEGYGTNVNCEEISYANGLLLLSAQYASGTSYIALKGYIQTSGRVSQTTFNGFFTPQIAGFPTGTNSNLLGLYKLKYASGIWVALSTQYASSDTANFMYSLDGYSWFPAMYTGTWQNVGSSSASNSSLCAIAQVNGMLIAVRGTQVYRSSLQDLQEYKWVE